MSDDLENGFLADGYRRAKTAVEPTVRADVEREYAERLSSAASPEEMGRLKREMERAIAARLDEIAPPDALY